MVKSESESEVAQSCPTLCDPMDCSLPGSTVHRIFPGKSTGVGCHFLLQEIFQTQGLNPGLPHCSVQFSRSVVSDYMTHEPQHARPPCPSPTPGVHPNLCPLLVMPSNQADALPSEPPGKSHGELKPNFLASSRAAPTFK